MEELLKKYDDLYEYFYFLEGLRQSGTTNMAGARPYLMDAYGLSKKDAWEILDFWTKHYNEIAKKLGY